MNGAENVSRSTRDRVIEASRRLNYIPNPAARALTTKRSRTIAAVVPTLEHSIFARFITAIEETLGARGYSLVVAVSREDPNEELRATNKLLGLGAEAFIYSGITHNPELLDQLDIRNIPCVFTSYWNAESPIATIGYDNASLATQAVRFLYDRGHRQISILHGNPSNNDRTAARVEGAKASQCAGLKLCFVETEISVEGGAFGTDCILASHPNTTAILCFSDIIALGALFELSRNNKRVPDDMSLMGFDNLDWAATSVPPLTTIDLPTYRMGRAASLALIEYLETGEPVLPVRLDGTIISRHSVAALAGTGK